MNPPYVITASVEIGGLPEGCLRTASETFAEEAGPPQAIKLGVVNGIHHQIHDNLLTKIENNLRDQSNDQLFLVLHFNKNATQITVDHTKKNLLRRLMTRKINPARVVFITTSDGQRRGIVWLVPPGANRPQP